MTGIEYNLHQCEIGFAGIPRAAQLKVADALRTLAPILRQQANPDPQTEAAYERLMSGLLGLVLSSATMLATATGRKRWTEIVKAAGAKYAPTIHQTFSQQG